MITLTKAKKKFREKFCVNIDDYNPCKLKGIDYVPEIESFLEEIITEIAEDIPSEERGMAVTQNSFEEGLTRDPIRNALNSGYDQHVKLVKEFTKKLIL